MQIYLSAAAVRMIGVHGNQVNNYRRACVRACVRALGAPVGRPAWLCAIAIMPGCARPLRRCHPTPACVLMDRYYNAVRIEPCSQRMN